MKQLLIVPPTSTPVTVEILLPDAVPATQSGGTPIGIPPIDPNLPPTADAGSDVTITLPNNSVLLSGRGSDPEGNTVSFKWTKVSGSGNLLAPNAANCEVVQLTAGVSVFRLVTTDNKGATSSPDDTTVTVKPAVIVIPPTTPGKYEGFGIGAASVLSMPVKEIRSKADFDNSIFKNNIILRFMQPLAFIGRYYLGNQSNIFIDANGFDVTIDGGGSGGEVLSIGGSSHHIIAHGLRVINSSEDCLNIVDSANNIIISNCSVYDGRDGNLDVAAGSGRNITVQNTIIGRGKSGFSGCMLITSQLVTVVRNLISPLGSANEAERCPFVHCNYSPAANPNADIRNNVIMNFGRGGGTGSGYGTAIGYGAVANVVNNYYYDKESAGSSVANGDGYGTGATGKLYSAGNHITNGSTILSASMANNRAEITIPDANKVSLLTALEAKAKVKAEVGPAVKNSYEQGLINAIP